MTFLEKVGSKSMSDTYHEPLAKLSLQKTVDISDVLFDSLYDSELPNAKGCAQWKIELELFGKGGSVIVYYTGIICIKCI